MHKPNFTSPYQLKLSERTRRPLPLLIQKEVKAMLDTWRMRNPDRVGFLYQNHAYFYAMCNLHRDYEFGSLVPKRQAMQQLNEYLDGMECKSPSKKDILSTESEAPVRIDLRTVRTHLPIRSINESKEAYDLRLQNAKRLDTLISKQPAAAKLRKQKGETPKPVYSTPPPLPTNTLSKLKETCRTVWESGCNLAKNIQTSIQRSTSSELRPGDIADLPAASRRYLVHVNRMLLKYANEGKAVKYKRLARQITKRSKSLSLWAVLHQIHKDGAKGTGPDI